MQDARDIDFMHGTGLPDGDDGSRNFHKSKKSAEGGLESRSGWKGLCRKGISLLIVLVSYRLDLIAGTNFICNAVMAAYLVNEFTDLWAAEYGRPGTEDFEDFMRESNYGKRPPMSKRTKKMLAGMIGAGVMVAVIVFFFLL